MGSSRKERAARGGGVVIVVARRRPGRPPPSYFLPARLRVQPWRLSPPPLGYVRTAMLDIHLKYMIQQGDSVKDSVATASSDNAEQATSMANDRLSAEASGGQEVSDETTVGSLPQNIEEHRRGRDEGQDRCVVLELPLGLPKLPPGVEHLHMPRMPRVTRTIQEREDTPRSARNDDCPSIHASPSEPQVMSDEDGAESGSAAIGAPVRAGDGYLTEPEFQSPSDNGNDEDKDEAMSPTGEAIG